MVQIIALFIYFMENIILLSWASDVAILLDKTVFSCNKSIKQ